MRSVFLFAFDLDQEAAGVVLEVGGFYEEYLVNYFFKGRNFEMLMSEMRSF